MWKLFSWKTTLRKFLTKSGTRANKFTQEIYNLLFDRKDEDLVSNCREGMKMKELPLTKIIIG